MEILFRDELLECFANTSRGYRKIKNYDKELYSYTDDKTFGLAFPCSRDLGVNESLKSISIYNIVEGNENYILLSCNNRSQRSAFVDFCVQNLTVGDDGYEKIVEMPLDWWREWADLIGNSFSGKKVYSLLAELMALKQIYSVKKNTILSSTKNGSIDIENDTDLYEIKSTLSKYNSTIIVSSQQQLKRSDKRNLYLVFFRFEKSESGYSVEQLKNELIKIGYNQFELEEYIVRQGYPENNHYRVETYKLLESRIYTIDETFPKITNESFKDNVIPSGISHITYEVDLSNIKFKDFCDGKNL